MDIGDVLGFGKASEKLLDVMSKGLGTVYRPIAIRREAAAKADEIRLLGKVNAEAEAERIRIVGLADAETKLIASQPDIDALLRAKARLVAREIERQKNLENIAEVALQELPENVSDTPVEDNWRTRFFNIAEDISDSQMQSLWGKILAGEVANPGRYSLRTLEVLRNLSRYEAELFQKVCGFAFEGGWIAKLETVSSPSDKFSFPEPPANDLKEFGFTYDSVLVLRAAGLLSSGDSLSKMFLAPTSENRSEKRRIVLKNNGVVLVLEVVCGDDFDIPSIVLTPAGRELQQLIPFAPNEMYLHRLAEGLRARNADLYPAKVIDGVVHPELRGEF